MIIYGSRATRLGNYEADNITCKYCEQKAKFRLSVFGKYAYLYWIPIFPMTKISVAECTNCLKTYEEREFPEELRVVSRETRKASKSPIWYFSGLILVAALFCLIKVSSFFSQRAIDSDIRNSFLDGDIATMSMQPAEAMDTVSANMKVMMDAFINEELNPQGFFYLTRQVDDKALVLVSIPEFINIHVDTQPEIIETVESLLETMDDMTGKQLYIGILDDNSVELTKTPDVGLGRSWEGRKPLLDFYGPK